MAITRGNATSGQGASQYVKSVSFTGPTCNPGDVLILAVASATGDTTQQANTTWPSGFTEAGRSLGSGHQLAWAWKMAESSDSGATLATSWTGATTSAPVVGLCMAFSGAAPLDSDFYSTRAVTNTNYINTPALANSSPTGSVEVMLVSCSPGASGNYDMTPPSSPASTEHAQPATNYGSPNITAGIGTVDGTFSGTTSARTWTIANYLNNAAATIALHPASTTTNDGSGATDTSSTWNNEANAYDGSGTTYADTDGTVTTHVLDVTGYDFASVIGASDTLVTVVVNVSQYVGDAARFNAPTVQAYNDTTALGSPVTLTERTSAGNEDVYLTGITLSDLRSANFKVRFSVAQTS